MSEEKKKNGKSISDEEVNHPDRYNKNGIEVIDIIEAYTKDLSGREAFDIANVFKYICRYKSKNGLEDLQKAAWYLDDAIKVNTDCTASYRMEKRDAEYKKNVCYVLDNVSVPDILNQLAEEASELAQAALKMSRTMSSTNPSAIDSVDAYANLLEEYSDVVNVATVMSISSNNYICEKKMERWANRIKEMKEKQLCSEH